MLDVAMPTPTPTPPTPPAAPKLPVLSLELWLLVPFVEMETELGVCWPLVSITLGNFENVHWFTRKTAIL